MRVVLIVLICAACMVAGGLAVSALIGEWMSRPYTKYAWKRAQWRNVSYEGPALAGVQSMGPGRRLWHARGSEVGSLPNLRADAGRIRFDVGARGYDSTDGTKAAAGRAEDVEEGIGPQAPGAPKEDRGPRGADL